MDVRDATGLLARDPYYDAPAEVYDPAVAACLAHSPDARACPSSPNLLYYPLVAACFYRADVSLATGYLEVLGCSFTGTIPEGAEKVSIAASGGYDIHYRFVVYE